MFRRHSGSSLIELALVLPMVVSIFIPAFQLVRLALCQMRLETLAFDSARFLARTELEGTDLSVAAEQFTAGVEPAVACRAATRTLTTLAVPSPRRPRLVEVVEVDLSAPGPRVLLVTPLLVAHAREFRWGPVP